MADADYIAPANISALVQQLMANVDHETFREHFACTRHHGNLSYGGPYLDTVVGTLVVTAYEPDPRCPDIVVWLVSEFGLRSPGVRRDWTLDRVRAEFARAA